MKSISTIIASLLILVIVIGLASTSYLFISGVFTGKLATAFEIVGTFNDTVTIRNLGTEPITSITATLDGESGNYLVLPRDSNLRGYWALDEGAGIIVYDSSGSGVDGTFVGVTSWADGYKGKSVLFGGISGNTIEFGNTIQLIGAVTYEAWIYPTRSDGNGDIIGLASYNPTWGYSFQMFSRTLNFRFQDSSGAWKSVSTTNQVVTLNKWQHVAVTYDLSSVKFYIDGKLVDLKPQTAIPGVATNNLKVGHIGWNPFEGRIDDARIYDRALSENEIWAEYNIGHVINPGEITTMKIYNQLSKGTHTLRLCTSSMCNIAFLTII